MALTITWTIGAQSTVVPFPQVDAAPLVTALRRFASAYDLATPAEIAAATPAILVRWYTQHHMADLRQVAIQQTVAARQATISAEAKTEVGFNTEE